MSASRGEVVVSPYYYEAKNEITQPSHFVACSRYFVRKWMPLLEGAPLAMVLYLRSLGYYNPVTGERRDGVRVGMKELAAACGVSDRTIQRELENHPWLRYFVQVESSYEQLPDGRIRHHENLYRIAMDDPIHPDDDPRLQEIIARREASGRPPDPATADRRVKRRTQTAVESRDSGASMNQGSTAADSANPISKIRNPKSPQDPLTIDSTPMSDILSPPSAGHGRQPVTRVASKCRLKDSVDIPNPDIHLDLLNNNTPVGEAAVAGEAEDVVVALDSLCSELVGRGVSRVTAKELIAGFSEAEIRLQLDALPHREANDPAAVLVKAIREKWAPPVALKQAKARETRQKVEREKTAERRAETEAREAVRSEMLERLETYWRDLPDTEQARVEAEARETLRRTNPFVAQLMERAGEGRIVRATLESLRRQILCARLGLDPP